MAAPKKSVSTERACRFRLKQMNTVGYNHEKTKKKHVKELRLYKAKKLKCPLGRKCKEDSCSLHPDRGRIRNRQPEKTRQLCALAERRLKQEMPQRNTANFK